MPPSSFYHYYPFPFKPLASVFSIFFSTGIQIHPVVTKFTTITYNYSPPFSLYPPQLFHIPQMSQ